MHVHKWVCSWSLQILVSLDQEIDIKLTTSLILKVWAEPLGRWINIYWRTALDAHLKILISKLSWFVGRTYTIWSQPEHCSRCSRSLCYWVLVCSKLVLFPFALYEKTCFAERKASSCRRLAGTRHLSQFLSKFIQSFRNRNNRDSFSAQGSLTKFWIMQR